MIEATTWIDLKDIMLSIIRPLMAVKVAQAEAQGGLKLLSSPHAGCGGLGSQVVPLFDPGGSEAETLPPTQPPAAEKQRPTELFPAV